MVPVQLRLSNFLSYGTRAPVLDFEQFHVACLSGRNGHGKSALLDAITWALWGEARKSSGSRKPDDELIHIGAQRMQVEFVFDLEGERYRVVRSYTRSPSGKTTRPELEIGIYEPGSGSYRPLTGASVRETQQQLDRLLGIEYETFINSAFILQGRSDEFTKKKPGERKEILSRILNLDRYEALAQLAREKERAAEDELHLIELEIERLGQALEKEPEWKLAYDDTESQLKLVQECLGKLKDEEGHLLRRKAELAAKEREAASLSKVAERTLAQITAYQRDEKQVQDRLEKAIRLIEEKDSIEKAFERYEMLQRERDELDGKRDLFRGVEKQIEHRQNELRDKKHELEKRAHVLQVELQTHQNALKECQSKLTEEPTVRRMLQKVRAAQERLAELNKTLERHNSLKENIANVEREIHGRKEALLGELRELVKQISSLEKTVSARNALIIRRKELTERLAHFSDLEKKLEETKLEGQRIAEDMKERSGQKKILEQEREKHREEYQRLINLEAEVCPTCGTELTADHRAHVEQKHKTVLETLDTRLKVLDEWMAEQEKIRDRLRSEYRELNREIESLKDCPQQLASIDEQLKTVQEAETLLERQRERADEIKRSLKDETFAGELQERLESLQKELESTPFDQVEYEQTRKIALQAERYEEKLSDLEQTAGKVEQLEKLIEKAEADLKLVRVQLDGPNAFADIQEQIRRLKEQLQLIGFDPVRFDDVRKSLRDLADAGDRMKDLLNAQQNRVEWENEIERIRKRVAEALEEYEKIHGLLGALEAELQQKPEVEALLQTKTEEINYEEEKLRAVQKQLGELSVYLEQAERDRKQLGELRKKHSEVNRRRTLYKQLKAAFGKHGIPSLIIEETLPEVEEKANALLERLTDGKMHVRLETLKDKKAGGTMETLEIIITDELGVPRAYETFSGGEAFRVNFALRIALAQLLAERSGVRVRTLVIDEGFGTQDTQGIEGLVEAIQVIKEDFDKIVVITHMDQIKEAFPVRIEVEKDPVDGSTFELMGV